MTGVQPVFPAGGGTGGSSPAAGAGGGGKGIRIGKLRLGQRELMIGGAAIVGGLALFARSRSGGDVAEEDDGTTDPSYRPAAYEIDTSRTDFYNELQPELEAISDRMEDLTGVVKAIPKPQAPRPPTPAPKPPKKKKRKPKAQKPGKKKPPKKRGPRRPPKKR